MNTPTGQFVVPNVVSSHFHIREGETVADFGAGIGNFIPELSRRVGDSGILYACEIQKKLAEALGAASEKLPNRNVHPLWCDLEEMNGVKIPDGVVDMGLLINTLYLLEDKETAVIEMARTLRRGAKFFVIDWTESYGGLGPTPEMVIEAAAAKDLFEQHGFVFETDFPAGAHHYGLAFKKL